MIGHTPWRSACAGCYSGLITPPLPRGLLEPRGAGYLEARGLVCVADISAMPGLVARMFALPMMRRHAYPVLLAREPRQTESWPRWPGQAGLYDPGAGQIIRVCYFFEPGDLQAKDPSGPRRAAILQGQ